MMRYFVFPAVSTLQPGSTPGSMTPSIVTCLGLPTGMPVGPGATVPPPPVGTGLDGSAVGTGLDGAGAGLDGPVVGAAPDGSVLGALDGGVAPWPPPERAGPVALPQPGSSRAAPASSSAGSVRDRTVTMCRRTSRPGGRFPTGGPPAPAVLSPL